MISGTVPRSPARTMLVMMLDRPGCQMSPARPWVTSHRTGRCARAAPLPTAHRARLLISTPGRVLRALEIDDAVLDGPPSQSTMRSKGQIGARSSSTP